MARKSRSEPASRLRRGVSRRTRVGVLEVLDMKEKTRKRVDVASVFRRGRVAMSEVIDFKRNPNASVSAIGTTVPIPGALPLGRAHPIASRG